MKIIVRNSYIDQLKNFIGMRKVGKSELLKAYLKYINFI